MSLSIVNSGKFQNTGSATLACTLGWTPAVGNCLIVATGDYDAGGATANPAVTDNQGNTYTRKKQVFDTGTPHVDHACFSAPNIASSGSFVVTLTTNQVTPTALTVFVIEVAGADTVTPIPDTPVGTTGTSTAPNSGNLTNTLDPTAIVFSFAFNTDTSATATFTDPGGSWTSLQSNKNGSTGVVGSIVYQSVTTSAARSATWTSSNFLWGAITFAVQALVPTQSIAVNDANVFLSPYNWVKNGSTYVQAYCAGAYIKLGFTGTSLYMTVDVTPLTGGGGTAAANYPVITATIDHGQWSGPIQLTSSSATIALASGLSAGTHTAWIFFRGFNNSVEAIDQWNLTAPYGALRVTGFLVDSGQASAATLLRAKRLLVYGDSISAGYLEDTGPQQASTGDTNNQYSFVEPIASAMNAEWGMAAYSATCLCTASTLGNNIPGLNPASGTGYWDHIDNATSRLSGGLLTPAPDFIIINIGWNDNNAGTSGATFLTQLNSLLSKLATAAPNADVFVMQPQGPNRQYATQFATASYTPRQVYVDLDAGYTNDPYSTGFQSGISFRSVDGVHNNSVSAIELAARVMGKVGQSLAAQRQAVGLRGGMNG